MKRLCFALLICLLFPHYSSAHSVRMTDDLTTKPDISGFDCRNRIYAYIIWDKIPIGPHILTAQWTNPAGELQETTHLEFIAPVKDSWVWLELRGGAGSKLFGAVAPEAGYERFIGAWSVKLYLDEKYFDQQPFFVTC